MTIERINEIREQLTGSGPDDNFVADPSWVVDTINELLADAEQSWSAGMDRNLNS